MLKFFIVYILCATSTLFSSEIIDQSSDLLTNLPLEIKLHLLDYIASDPKTGTKDIKSIACINTEFNSLCGFGKIDEEIKRYKRSEMLKNAILKNLKINEANVQKFLDCHKNNLLKFEKMEYLNIKKVYTIRITENNARQILDIATKNNLPDLKNKVYKNISYESTSLENLKDFFACILPWYHTPWKKKWENACQERYKTDIKAKYGIELNSVYKYSNNRKYQKGYKKYREPKKVWLGAGLCILLSTPRTFAQIACCPLCCCATICSISVFKNDTEEFKKGENFFGWLLWPFAKNCFECLDEGSGGSN